MYKRLYKTKSLTLWKKYRIFWKTYYTPSIDLTLLIDARHNGWDATDSPTPTGERWHEDLDHINVLELKATKFSILAFCRGKQFQHIISTIWGNNSKTCNILAQKNWQIYISQNLWPFAAHINPTADLMSRVFNDNTEWKLCSKLLRKL